MPSHLIRARYSKTKCIADETTNKCFRRSSDQREIEYCATCDAARVYDAQKALQEQK